jgi:membrane protein
VMISWMEGFRRCYELPKSWGLIKERLIAFMLVIFALIPMTFSTLLVAVGSKFETRLLPYIDPDFSAYVLLLWGIIRWIIATLTSISVIALIYHNAVPRTQPWHSVIPGAVFATFVWFTVTVGFRYYLQHFGDFTTIYGSLGVGMALLVWMYLISLVVLVGAEFNALLFPRAMLGKELTAINSSRA